MKVEEMVADIRSGQDSIRNRINSERFNTNRLDHWLERNKELCAINKFQHQVAQQIKNKITVSHSAQSLREQMSSLKIRFGFELAFKSRIKFNPSTELMALLIKDNTSENIDTTKRCWWEEADVVERMEKDVSVFVKLAEKLAKQF
jgi:ATP-dependent Lon protease